MTIPNSITKPNLILAYRLKVFIKAIELEGKGMRHSSGLSAVRRAKQELGVSSFTNREQVIKLLQNRIETLERMP